MTGWEWAIVVPYALCAIMVVGFWFAERRHPNPATCACLGCQHGRDLDFIASAAACNTCQWTDIRGDPVWQPCPQHDPASRRHFEQWDQQFGKVRHG